MNKHDGVYYLAVLGARNAIQDVRGWSADGGDSDRDHLPMRRTVRFRSSRWGSSRGRGTAARCRAGRAILAYLDDDDFGWHMFKRRVGLFPTYFTKDGELATIRIWATIRIIWMETAGWWAGCCIAEEKRVGVVGSGRA